MPYLNVDDQLAFHRKTVRAGNAAMGLWVRAGSWTAGQEWPEGEELDGYIPEDIAKALGTPAQIKALTETGWWEKVPILGGYMMHDYEDHNITIAESRALSAKRAEAGRRGGQSRRPGLNAIKAEANGHALATANGQPNA